MTTDNGTHGVYLEDSKTNTAVDLLSQGNNTGSSGGSDLYVWGDSNALASTVRAGTCSGDIGSAECNTGIVAPAIDSGSFFVGRALQDDTVNTSDTDGRVDDHPGDSDFDWTGFENSFRAWGKSDGKSFPSEGQRGRWDPSTDENPSPGQIWDWSLADRSPLIGQDLLWENMKAITQNDSYPRFSPTEAVTHTWSSEFTDADCTSRGGDWDGKSCTSTFLRYAHEVLLDGIGNENGLCDAGETCIYAPNLASYQGHGKLVDADWFTSPADVPSVTLLEYEHNGR